MYIHDLFSESWKDLEAPTQYLGEGKSHELASLLLTEAVQNSLHATKEPIFLLFLDAKSAFDRVVRQFLIRELYFSGMDGNSLLYIDHRLGNRKTFLEWNKILMGPIQDNIGLEQGGINSGDFYKLYNNEQLDTAQRSELGVQISGVTVSSIGDADDVVLCTNDIHKLQCLLLLSELYCKKFKVELCAEKTRLLAITTRSNQELVDIEKMTNTISLNGANVTFEDTAEHVGIVRSVSGNLVNLFDRITRHKRALGAILGAGLAQSHRANPAAGLKIQQIYGEPKLMSGLASLVLNSSEIELITQHAKKTIENNQKLLPKTPASVVYFLGGSLPGKAILHLKQITLFGMICRLPGNILHTIAVEKLSFARISSSSWFLIIRDLCLLYELPHPLELLSKPLTKPCFKKLVKSHIIDYWERFYRTEASSLQSLQYFHPCFMSLVSPHPIWTSAKSNPYEVHKARVQAIMLSGRYRTELLTSNWTTNDGTCLLPSCSGMLHVESIEHILIFCPALADARTNVFRLWFSAAQRNPQLSPIIRSALTSSITYRTQFLLDCSVLPEVIRLVQSEGSHHLDQLLYLSRTLCYALHRERLKLLGKWKSC